MAIHFMRASICVRKIWMCRVLMFFSYRIWQRERRKRLVLWEVFFFYIFVSSMASHLLQSSLVHREKKWKKKFKWRLRLNSFMEDFMHRWGFWTNVLLNRLIIYEYKQNIILCWKTFTLLSTNVSPIEREIFILHVSDTDKSQHLHRLISISLVAMTFLDYCDSGIPALTSRRKRKWFDGGRVVWKLGIELWNFCELLEKIFPH